MNPGTIPFPLLLPCLDIFVRMPCRKQQWCGLLANTSVRAWVAAGHGLMSRPHVGITCQLQSWPHELNEEGLHKLFKENIATCLHEHLNPASTATAHRPKDLHGASAAMCSWQHTYMQRPDFTHAK